MPLRSFLLVAAAAAFLAGGADAQQVGGDDALARVEAGLRNGDAEAVLVDAAPRLEIVLFGQGGTYRRSQAVHVLRDFFRRYPPDRVAFADGSQSDDGRTAIGRYWAQDGGAPLTLRVLHRVSDDEWALVSIRVEQQSIIRTGGR